MNLLMLMNPTPHGHCYGVDYLTDGLREVLGAEHVWDWPEKECLHIPPGMPRDPCNIDSDAWWPRHGRQIEQMAAEADAVLIARGPMPAHDVMALVPATTPVAAVEMGDQLGDHRALYEQAIGRPLAAYFKRETPLGATWAIPCPLTYPAHKVPDPLPLKQPRVFYHASAHGWSGPGLPRMQIAEALAQALVTRERDVLLTTGQTARLSPEDYHARMAACLVGVSWNGAANWDSNRFWENCAFGLVQVAERPRIEIPNPPQHLRHVLWADTPEEVAPLVRMLIRTPDWALQLAEGGRQHFLAHHCAAARARWVLRHLFG